MMTKKKWAKRKKWKENENGEELHGGENEEGEGKEFITNYYDDDLFLEQKATLRKKYKNY